MPNKPAYQQRVLDERKELNGRLEKLDAFINTDPFNDLEQADKYLLLEQHVAMHRYQDALDLRIRRFEENADE